MMKQTIPSTPETDRHAMTAAHFDGAVSLTSGTIVSHSDDWRTETLTDGLKIVVIETGELDCKFSGRPLTRIVGPCVCAIWNEGLAEGAQAFPPGCRLRYTIVTVSSSSCERYFGPLKQQFGTGPKLTLGSASQSVRVLCSQATACPLQGAVRQFYLSGKALEIVAQVIDAFDAGSETMDGLHFTVTDVEKVRAAQELLLARLDNPPSLPELALAVGTNVRKLTSGFRQVFGDSVFGYLQKERLEIAYRLLSEGQTNIATIAYQVGYSPAHFSVAFRKKFGISPKDISRR